jgi:VanZ family protein
LWRALGFIMVAFVIFASLIPQPDKVLPVHYWDKAEHATAYAVMALWFGGVYSVRRYGYVGLLLLAMGVALEFIQAHVGRHFDVMDMVADALGILLGLGISLTRLNAGLLFSLVETIFTRHEQRQWR